MSDLLEFLELRIAIDEVEGYTARLRGGGDFALRVVEAQRAIIARETGQRTLDREAMGAQVEYARDGVAVVTACGERFEGAEADEWLAQHSTQVTDTPILRILAAIYRDHPDYREEWKP